MSGDFTDSLRDEPRSERDEYEGDVDAVLHAQAAGARHMAQAMDRIVAASEPTPAQEFREGQRQEVVEALLAWRAVDRVVAPGEPEWWPPYYRLRDLADRIDGQAVTLGYADGHTSRGIDADAAARVMRGEPR